MDRDKRHRTEKLTVWLTPAEKNAVLDAALDDPNADNTSDWVRARIRNFLANKLEIKSRAKAR